MYSKPLTFYVMRLSYFSNDKKSLSQQLYRFGKLFRKVLFSFEKYFPKAISASVKTFPKSLAETTFPTKTFHV